MGAVSWGAAAAGACAGAFAAFWVLRFRWVLPLELEARASEEEAASARALLAMLSEAQGVPASAGMLRDQLHQLLSKAQGLAPGVELWLFVREGRCWELLAQTAEPNPVTGAAEVDDATLARLLADGRPVRVSTAAGWEKSASGLFKALEAQGLASVAVFRGGAGPDWVLAAASPLEGGLPLTRARTLLEALSRYCGGFVQTARQTWELRRREKELKDSMALSIQELTSTNIRLAQRSREMKTLYQVASTLSVNPSSPGASLSALVAIIAKSLEADLCAFMLLDQEKSELVTQPGAYGLAGDEASLLRLPLNHPQATSVRAFLSGEPYLTGAAREAPEPLGSWARQWKAQSLMVVPLKAEGRAIGVLRIGSMRGEQFGEDALRFAGLLAREAAVIIQSAMRYQQVAQTAQQLADLNRLKDDFISTVSHELKTPLTSIQGFLAVLLSGDAGRLDEQQRRFLTIAKNAANRLTMLITDLLDLSKLEGGVLMSMGEVSLAELARHAVELHAPQAAEAGVDLRLAAPERLPPVWADAKWIQHVIDNLVSNALKFTPAGGTVAISFQDKGDMVVATVSDTGIGIADKHKDRIFEKFYRVRDNPAFNPPGTGLGLSIARFVVEKHKGKIWLESEPGRGSRFHFVLPAVRREEAPAGAPLDADARKAGG